MTVEAVKGKEIETEKTSVSSQLPAPQGYKKLIELP